MNLTSLNIIQIQKGLKKKKFSAMELAKAYLDRISQRDSQIRSFITVDAQGALLQAKKTDEFISSRADLPPLAGIPLVLKDNIMLEGLKCTAGSKVLENYKAPYDATCVSRLKKQGAVFLGKANLDEFAMGSSCENSAFFPTKNPNDLSRVPGGSSGGPAAAVADGMACYALGSDTGGSIRLPASFCGVVGLKPTYGTVSRFGLISMASSLDQIGPFTKSARDARMVFQAFSGKDPLDSTSLEYKLGNSKISMKGLKIGVPKEYFVRGMDKKTENMVRGSIKEFEKKGALIKEVSLPHTDYALAAYYIIMACEVSSNLARYDGIKYGFSAKGSDLLEVYLKSRSGGFGQEVARRIMLGTYALSSGYYQAYYLRAQKVRTKIIEDFRKVFSKIDVLMAPTSPTPAFKLGQKKKDPVSMYLSDIFTTSVNLAGLPAVSIPVGKADNLPVGLQIIGKPFEENKILSLGEKFEQTPYEL